MLFYATISGCRPRPLVRSWREGEKIASQFGGELKSLTAARTTRGTKKYIERLLDLISCH